MTSFSGDLAGGGDGASASGLTEADRALLLSLRVWGKECRRGQGAATEQEEEHDFILRLWDWLEPGWAHRLCEAWDGQAQTGDRYEGARALDRLRQMHVASARVELGQVHPSWLVRALREESPAVGRLVAANVPESLRHSIQAGLLLDGQDVVPDRPVHPILQEWVMGLWTERLVGGEAARPDDPPALVAICGLSPRAGYRLCRLAGLGKMILAGEKLGKGRVQPSHRERAEWLHGRLSASELEFQTRARGDVQSIVGTKLPRRLHAARIGLFSLARLLADCEPFRLRWALQHWPYPIVKLIRSLMSGSEKRTPGLLRGETLLLKTVWERLRLEGRLAVPWPEPRGGENESRST